LDSQGLSIPKVSVNVSAHQLESGTVGADVRRALTAHGLDGERLVLELTESLLMRDVHNAAHTLHELKQLGVRTAVDDFGTGYSSLAYLNRLPLDTLKIDRAFIAPIAEAGGDTRITEAVIALARTLKLRAVAEGVETQEQMQFLLRNGCTVMQGYYFSRPVPAEAVPALLATKWMVAGRQEVRRVTA
jgi:EAL domain-containing protein (putative c-di-GMP-specific phosphodiesterase class I)